MFGFLQNISSTELIVIVLILVFFFGGKTIKTLAKTSGATFRDIKKTKKIFTDALKNDDSKSKEE